MTRPVISLLAFGAALWSASGCSQPPSTGDADDGGRDEFGRDGEADACGAECWAHGLCQHGTLPSGECRCVECTDGWDDFADAGDVEDDGDRPPHECPPLGDDSACLDPGIDEGLGVLQTVPGDCWCIRPEVTDLSAQWYQPSAACEQVTYLDYLAEGFPALWDVWDGVVFSSARPGIQLWDPDDRKASVVASRVPAGVRLVSVRGSDWGIAYSAILDCGDFLISYETSTHRKRLLSYRRPALNDDGMCDQFGYRLPLDICGSEVLVRRSESSTGACWHRLTKVDALSGLEEDLGPPTTLCPWDAQMSDGRVVFSGGGSWVGLITLDMPTFVAAYPPVDACQWLPTVSGDSVCWADNLGGTGCGDGTWTGSRIACSDIGSNRVDVLSDATSWEPSSPSVHGDWVAWQTQNPRLENPFEVWLYHRGKGLRFRLADAATGLPAPTYTGYQGYGYPRVWGDYVYFQADGADETRRAGNVYRCNLRTLFPEAYE